MDEGMGILRTQYILYINGSFTCRKILRHGTSGFTSHPKEGVLIFIALKYIASAWFEPATLRSNGRHTNHYTNNVTKYLFVKC
jgi:hypothetical protein